MKDEECKVCYRIIDKDNRSEYYYSVCNSCDTMPTSDLMNDMIRENKFFEGDFDDE